MLPKKVSLKKTKLTNPFKSSNSQTRHIQSLPIKTISPIPAVSSHTSECTLKTKNKMLPKPTKSNSVSLLRCQQSDRHERTLKTINNQIWQPCNQNTNAGSGHTRMQFKDSKQSRLQSKYFTLTDCGASKSCQLHVYCFWHVILWYCDIVIL